MVMMMMVSLVTRNSSNIPLFLLSISPAPHLTQHHHSTQPPQPLQPLLPPNTTSTHHNYTSNPATKLITTTAAPATHTPTTNCSNKANHSCCPFTSPVPA